MTAPDLDMLEALRRPFPPEQIHQIPRGNTMLDYVGHADVTHRLLDVDPCWSWEPFAVDTETELPKIVVRGQIAELWIRLTIAGHTRIGVGTCPTTKPEVSKELIGDALRNAALRFGVALDLWSKSDLAHQTDPDPPGRRVHDAGEHLVLISPEQQEEIRTVFQKAPEADRPKLQKTWADRGWRRPANVEADRFDDALRDALDIVEQHLFPEDAEELSS